MVSFKKIKSWLRHDKGSVSVEFAMVGVGFVFLMVGVLELGRFAWTSNVIDYAVDEAARYAVLHQGADNSEIEDHAKKMLDAFFVPSSALDLNISNTSSSGVSFIEISGTYSFTSMTTTILPDSFSSITLDVNSRRPIYIYDEDAGG